MTVQLLLYLLGFVCLLLAAVGVGVPRVSLGWLGLALVVFAFGILPAIQQ